MPCFFFCFHSSEALLPLSGNLASAERKDCFCLSKHQNRSHENDEKD